VPQPRRDVELYLEQSRCHVAADGRDHSPQQHFWAALMVQTSALPSRSVRHLQLSEDFLHLSSDIYRSLKPCPQAQLRSRSSGMAPNWSQRPCQPYEEARLRWGLVSFFTGAPLHARASVPALRMLSVCCLHACRTVVAMSFESGHDPGGYRHLLLELRAPLRGHVAAGGRGEERGRAARAMCMCVRTGKTIWHVRWENSGVSGSLYVILGALSAQAWCFITWYQRLRAPRSPCLRHTTP
jgi:hypothetical protein